MKVKDEPDLVRDMSNNVVQNINKAAYEAYINRRDSALASQERLEAIEKDNEEIKNTLSQILELLKGKS